MGPMNFFIYKGRCSKDFGVYISGDQTFNAPERDIESIEIPGKNGNLTISRNRFKNISISYTAFIRRNFRVNSNGMKKWLLNGDGYFRLEDTYHPEFYRMAQFIGPVSFDMHFLNRAGEMTLTFDCKPQRWRKDGETPIPLSEHNSLYNELFPALPLIKVNGTAAGNLYVGSYTVEIKELDGYIMIDCESQNAYKDTLNKNNTILTKAFPVLQPGENTISWDGGISDIEITPRWWTI